METYTARTFSSQRYDLWTMQSAYHTLLPSFDGVMQAPGESFAARETDHHVRNGEVVFATDIAGAYPSAAGVERWRREVRLQRGRGIEVTDAWRLSRDVAEVRTTLLTPCTVSAEAGGRLELGSCALPGDRQSAAGRLEFDPELAVEVERLPLQDAKLSAVWGTELRRVVFTLARPQREGRLFWRIAGDQ